jgi:hypothetical protein
MGSIPVSLAVTLEKWKHQLLPSPPMKAINRAMLKLGSPNTVLTGPLRGMQYVGLAAGSAYLPKVVGSYESELHEILQQVISFDVDLMIDVGCAEGYYAVGIARVCPKATIIAYDIDPRARFLSRRLARINGVGSRVVIREKATPQSLSADLRQAKKPFILCDCEGFEEDILIPAQIPELEKTLILVELHDFIRPNLQTTMVSRFERTHNVRLIDSKPRPELPPELKLGDEFYELLQEGRPEPQVWMYLEPR